MIIYFVRHGQTDWNLERRWQSHTDVPLNKTGIQQAHLLRDCLLKQQDTFAAAYVSPLKRAQATADIILQAYAIKAQTESALIEINIGDFEGRLESDLRQEFGDEYTSWRNSHFVNARPGGENIADVKVRVMPFLHRLKQLHDQQTVVLVAHQGVNMAMKACLADVDDAVIIGGFAQTNEEIDVWDTSQRCSLMRHNVAIEYSIN